MKLYMCMVTLVLKDVDQLEIKAISDTDKSASYIDLHFEIDSEGG